MGSNPSSAILVFVLLLLIFLFYFYTSWPLFPVRFILVRVQQLTTIQVCCVESDGSSGLDSF